MAGSVTIVNIITMNKVVIILLLIFWLVIFILMEKFTKDEYNKKTFLDHVAIFWFSLLIPMMIAGFIIKYFK